MPKETVAQEALRLLTPIPAEDFITGKFSDGRGKCCAIGHIKRLQSNNPSDYSSFNCAEINRVHPIRSVSAVYLKDVHNAAPHANIASVNNNDINGYTEPVIKDRVIHLLNDMIAAGY